ARVDLCAGSVSPASHAAWTPQARRHRGISGPRLGRGADRQSAVAAAVAGVGPRERNVPAGRAEQPDGLCAAWR
ncbi:hypothetical protein, partial [Acinetobacter baumannii]|uniref:hypothetical protein n=1 Tax=Acinetobacter baumannii TaxID=470 RepID=UPI0013D71FC9